MPDFDLTGELSLKIEMHMLRPITEKVHSGNGPVSLVLQRCSDAPYFKLSGVPIIKKKCYINRCRGTTLSDPIARHSAFKNKTVSFYTPCGQGRSQVGEGAGGLDPSVKRNPPLKLHYVHRYMESPS